MAATTSSSAPAAAAAEDFSKTSSSTINVEQLLKDTVISLDNQTYQLQDGARASHFTKDGELIRFIFEDAKTTYEAFLRGKRVSNDGPCLGTRVSSDGPYSWTTYSTVEERFVALGAGITSLGIPPGQSSFVGVYGINCAEWVIADLSNSAYSRVTVALYDTLGEDAVRFIINQADIKCVICASNKVEKLVKAKQDSCPQLQHVIVFDESVNEDAKRIAEEAGIELFTMNQIEEKGRSDATSTDDLLKPAKPEDIATICYTSGTTGQPKGVIITHENIISDVSASYLHTGYKNTPCGPHDVHMSYLPLAHMMERVLEMLFYMSGGRVGFFRGDLLSLTSDVQELKPTWFLTVPRLLNKMYDKVQSALEGSVIKKWLFNKAFQSKLADVRRGITRKDSLWDTLVFRKIQNILGGNVRNFLFGSAPVSSAIKDFVQVAFGCQIYEGYGQTESTAGLCFTFPFDTDVGHVGSVFACAHVKLIDVPEMNYFAANGEGEVCFKGPCMTQGYYKNPEKTAELFDEDGWAKTGDVGKWLANGTLKIVDRKKNIFKLSQGEYIAPEKVENICVRSMYIAQMLVYGDSLKDFCVAVVVPDKDMVTEWAKGHGRQETTFEDLCKDEEVYELVYNDMKQTAVKNGLNSLETPKKISLCCEMFSVENGLLTPTFKLKHQVASEYFMDKIQALYNTD